MSGTNEYCVQVTTDGVTWKNEDHMGKTYINRDNAEDRYFRCFEDLKYTLKNGIVIVPEQSNEEVIEMLERWRNKDYRIAIRMVTDWQFSG